MAEDINVCLGIESARPSDVASEMRSKNNLAIEHAADLTDLPHKDIEVAPFLVELDDTIALSRNGDRAATKKIKTLVKKGRLFNRENATCVQKIARTRNDPSFPILVGYKLFKKRKSTKTHDFDLVQKGSGEILAIVSSYKPAHAYVWQYFEDGVWIFAEGTRKSSFLFKGLTPLTKYKFRYAHILSDGQGEWIESAEITVI